MNEVARHMDALNFLLRAFRIEVDELPIGRLGLTDDDIEQLDSEEGDLIPHSEHEYLRNGVYMQHFMGISVSQKDWVF